MSAKQAYRMSDGLMPIIVYANSAEEAHRILTVRVKGLEPAAAKKSGDTRSSLKPEETQPIIGEEFP